MGGCFWITLALCHPPKLLVPGFHFSKCVAQSPKAGPDVPVSVVYYFPPHCVQNPGVDPGCWAQGRRGSFLAPELSGSQGQACR